MDSNRLDVNPVTINDVRPFLVSSSAMPCVYDERGGILLVLLSWRVGCVRRGTFDKDDESFGCWRDGDDNDVTRQDDVDDYCITRRGLPFTAHTNLKNPPFQFFRPLVAIPCCHQLLRIRLDCETTLCFEVRYSFFVCRVMSFYYLNISSVFQRLN